jgi:hypothetical protein
MNTPHDNFKFLEIHKILKQRITRSQRELFDRLADLYLELNRDYKTRNEVLDGYLQVTRDITSQNNKLKEKMNNIDSERKVLEDRHKLEIKNSVNIKKLKDITLEYCTCQGRDQCEPKCLACTIYQKSIES